MAVGRAGGRARAGGRTPVVLQPLCDVLNALLLHHSADRDAVGPQPLFRTVPGRQRREVLEPAGGEGTRIHLQAQLAGARRSAP
jgi:hypothetical protein